MSALCFCSCELKLRLGLELMLLLKSGLGLGVQLELGAAVCGALRALFRCALRGVFDSFLWMLREKLIQS